MIEILSVNVGAPKTYPWRGGTESSIVKQPQQGAVILGIEGFAGNDQADLKNHGGEDKAVLCLPAENYAHFGVVEQPYGYLGENLTLNGLDETQVAVGDQLQVGDAILEVTQPRSPCWKLSALTENPHFTRQYAESGRVGFYCRVIQPGAVQCGDAVTWTPADVTPRTVIQTLFLAKYRPQTEQDWRILEQIVTHVALSTAWRTAIEKQLAEREGK